LTASATQQNNSDFRRRIKQYLTPIYYVGFILSIVTLLLAVFGSFGSSLIFIILIFCFLIPLFIAISYQELQESKPISSGNNTSKIRVTRIFIKKGKIIGRCIVCNLPIDEFEETLNCPNCSGLAHTTHLLEWTKIKGFCPNCDAFLKSIDLYPIEKELVHV